MTTVFGSVLAADGEGAVCVRFNISLDGLICVAPRASVLSFCVLECTDATVDLVDEVVLPELD